MGSYGPVAKTAALGIKEITSNKKKEAKAIERQEKNRYIRLPLEILGNAGYIPLYKEVRKAVMDDIYKDLKKSGVNMEELKNKNPKLYEKFKKMEEKFSDEDFKNKLKEKQKIMQERIKKKQIAK